MKPIGPIFGKTKPWEWTKDTEKLKKLQTICENTNYKQFAKTQIIEICSKYTERINKVIWAAFENHLDLF